VLSRWLHCCAVQTQGSQQGQLNEPAAPPQHQAPHRIAASHPQGPATGLCTAAAGTALVRAPPPLRLLACSCAPAHHQVPHAHRQRGDLLKEHHPAPLVARGQVGAIGIKLHSGNHVGCGAAGGRGQAWVAAAPGAPPGAGRAHRRSAVQSSEGCAETPGPTALLRRCGGPGYPCPTPCVAVGALRAPGGPQRASAAWRPALAPRSRLLLTILHLLARRSLPKALQELPLHRLLAAYCQHASGVGSLGKQPSCRLTGSPCRQQLPPGARQGWWGHEGASCTPGWGRTATTGA
jgi:hypothetical protein